MTGRWAHAVLVVALVLAGTAAAPIHASLGQTEVFDLALVGGAASSIKRGKSPRPLPRNTTDGGDRAIVSTATTAARPERQVVRVRTAGSRDQVCPAPLRGEPARGPPEA